MAQRWPASSPSLDSPPHSRPSNSYFPQNRQPSHSPHASRTLSRGTLPLTIQNRSRQPSAPPALIPPPVIPLLDGGIDLAWQLQNREQESESESRQVSPRKTSWDRRESLEYRPSTSERWENRRRESSTSTLMTADVDMNPFRDEPYSPRGSVSFSQLQGEKPLEKQNRKDSSQAYDTFLKSKIGRPKTPTQSSTVGSIAASPAATKSRTGSQAARPLQLQTLTISDRLSDQPLSASSDSFRVTSPFSSKFVQSPQSAAASPGLISLANSAQSYATDLQRSPVFDNQSVASSHTSYGGSLQSEMAGDQPTFTRGSVRSKPLPTDSNLSLAMKAVSAASAANSAASSLSLSASSQQGGKNASSGGAKRSSGHGRGARGNEHGHGGKAVVGGSGSGSAPGMFNRATTSNQAGHPPASETPETDRLPLAQAEPGADIRYLQLDDSSAPQSTSSSSNTNPPPFPRLHSQPSRSGMKRKATTPPAEASHHEERQSASAQAQHQQLQGAASEQQRRTPGQHHPLAKRASPVFHPPAHHHPSYPSYSSSSSTGLSANGPYASPFPVAASSIVTPSSQHQDRLSPAAITKPLEQETHASPYMSSLSLDPGLGGNDSQGQPQFNVDLAQQLAAAAAAKVSTENANRAKQQNPPRHSAIHHICDCCPKKPKKFDTLEELRQHQAEKQYVCQYCHNRFKNKNEAERHQNSLHLRRHSWSCATLERNFEAAFHPCTATPPNANSHGQPQCPPGTIAPYDVCGYCGEEFTNIPQPDWLLRGEHLTAVHKFSECNQSKKFFRADHFRQHLKHSHGGTSGKWTNMLEAACMKEEPPVTPEAQNQEQLRLQQQQQAQAAHAAQQAAQQAVQQSQMETPVLTQYQAAQLQGASGAPVANMMGQSGLRQGPYPAAMPMGPQSTEVQYGAIPGEEGKQQ
ncbi:hypothetical protein MMC10_001142 [Thelotrema lepadinum]|nr:hypothetical protein [Thelotrema lepadinum]